MPDEDQFLPKWVIIILIYADFRHEKGILVDSLIDTQLRTLFYDICKCTLNDNFKIYVVINRIRYIGRDERGVRTENDRTFIYSVAPGKAKRNDLVLLENGNIDNSASGSLQTAKQLTDVLNIIYDLEKLGKPKYLLNTWDHGNGFGINKERVINPNDGTTKFIPTTVSKLETLKPADNSPFWHPFNFLNSLFTKSRREREKDKIMLDFLQNIPGYVGGLTDTHDHNTFRVNSNPITITNSSNELINKLNQLADQGVGKEHFVKIRNHHNRTFIDVYDGDGNSEMAIVGGEVIEDGTEVLTNAELATAIAKSLERVDILLMMNCSMMNVYTQFTMKDNVDYLVAPPSSIGALGYNYRSIFSKAAQAGITPEHLARHCVDSCKDIPATYANDQYSAKDFAVLVVLAVDLVASRKQLTNSSFSNMDLLLSVILSELESGDIKPVDFENVRDKSEVVTYKDEAQFQDFLNWLRLLTAYFEYERPVQPPIAFIEQIRQCAASINNGKNLLASFPTQPTGDPRIMSGLSVYYPYRNNFETSTAFSQYFSKATYAPPFDNFKKNWVRFLKLTTRHT